MFIKRAQDVSKNNNLHSEIITFHTTELHCMKHMGISFLFTKTKHKSAKSDKYEKSEMIQCRLYVPAVLVCFPLVSDGPMVRDLRN